MNLICLFIKLHNKLKQKLNKSDNKVRKEQKWVTYTYNGNYILKITKLLKNTNINIAFKTSHTIGKLINEKRETNPYELTREWSDPTCQNLP
jgi:hypothetical protein